MRGSLAAGRPDHLAPLLRFVGEELSKVGGRAGNHRAAQIGEARRAQRPAGEATLADVGSAETRGRKSDRYGFK